MPVELETIKLSVEWVRHLVERWAVIRQKRERELDVIAEIGGDLESLVKVYVVPDGQHVNPVDHDENMFLRIAESAWKILGGFFSGPVHPTRNGANQLFVLADAGMGKTSLLTMLAVTHAAEFWPSKTQVKLFKLGENTLSELPKEDRRKTILLLDALDEDPKAWDRIDARIREILNETQSFRRVVITCRTQFFPHDAGRDPFERPGQVLLGDYSCPALYLSPFSDEQVDQYLSKRFTGPDRTYKQSRARTLVGRMQSLRLRPLMLSYVEYLLDSTVQDPDEEFVYNALVREWLRRESLKLSVMGITQESSAERLLRACRDLARWMFASGRAWISETELEILVRTNPDVKNIPYFDVGGRSLLNKNSRGNFRFAHYSVQEFLVVQSILDAKSGANAPFVFREPINQVRSLTQQQLAFLYGRVSRLTETERASFTVSDLVLDGLNLARVNFRLCALRGLSARNSLLTRADFCGAILNGSDFSNSTGEQPQFDRAKLDGVRFAHAKLVKLTAQGATMMMCSFDHAELRKFNLQDADLCRASFEFAVVETGSAPAALAVGARFCDAKLRAVDLSGSNLSGADFSRATLESCNLKNANLTGANMSNARLERGSLSGVDLRGANLAGARFNGVILEHAVLSGAVLLGLELLGDTDLRLVSLQGLDLRGTNLEEALIHETDFVGAKITTVQDNMILSKRGTPANALVYHEYQIEMIPVYAAKSTPSIVEYYEAGVLVSVSPDEYFRAKIEPIYQESLSDPSLERALKVASLSQSAALLRDTGYLSRAEAIYRRAIELLGIISGVESAEYADALKNLGEVLLATGKKEEADPMLVLSAELSERLRIKLEAGRTKANPLAGLPKLVPQ